MVPIVNLIELKSRSIDGIWKLSVYVVDLMNRNQYEETFRENYQQRATKTVNNLDSSWIIVFFFSSWLQHISFLVFFLDVRVNKNEFFQLWTNSPIRSELKHTHKHRHTNTQTNTQSTENRVDAFKLKIIKVKKQKIDIWRYIVKHSRRWSGNIYFDKWTIKISPRKFIKHLPHTLTHTQTQHI